MFCCNVYIRKTSEVMHEHTNIHTYISVQVSHTSLCNIGHLLGFDKLLGWLVGLRCFALLCLWLQIMYYVRCTCVCCYNSSAKEISENALLLFTVFPRHADVVCRLLHAVKSKSKIVILVHMCNTTKDP